MNKPLILIVEDDAPIRNLISVTLEAHEYRHIVAANAATAILQATSHNPDIMLLDLGLPQDGVRLADGSGLSRMNYISARWLTEFLQAMQKSPAFPAFLATLPAPGQGTLNGIRIKCGERIRMKSGSMDGVLCYSGYILDENGAPAYTFSILTNNATAPAREVRPVLTGFLEFLLSL